MKKFTLVASMLCMTALTTFADSKFGNWTLNGQETKLDGYVYWSESTDMSDESVSNQVVLTSDGAQIVTGYGINPATGWSLHSIVTKTGANGWTKSIDGAKITSVAADNAGGVYVTGIFGTTVTIGDKTLTGYNDSDFNKCATFVAHYDKDGNVLAAVSIVPTKNQDLIDKYQYYGQAANTVYCKAVKLVMGGTTPYLLLNFTDKLSTADGSKIAVSGNYAYDNYGAMFAGSTASCTLAKLDSETLGITDFVFTAKGNDYSDATNYGTDVTSSTCAIIDGHLYVAAYFKGNGCANGNIQAGQSDLVKLNLTYSSGSSKAFALADVNLSDMTMTYKLYNGTYDWNADGKGENNFNSIYANGDNLIITGTSTGKSLFDDTKSATGNADVFVASVKKSDFSSNWVALSGAEEASESFERVTASAVCGNKVYVGAYVGKEGSYAGYTKFTNNYLYAVDMTSGALESVASSDYVFGLASAGANQLYVSSYTNETTALNLGLYTIGSGSGISGVKAEKAGDAKIYNLQGQRLSAPVKGQINIVNGKKVMF